MLRRARQSVYWPGIDAEVEQKKAPMCGNAIRTPPPAPQRPSCPPAPQYPFQQVMADLFQLDGHTYIAVADRLSEWLKVEHLSGDATSARLITVFRRWSKRFGIPEELLCDGERTSPARNPGASSTPGVCGTPYLVDASLYEVSERWAWLLRERERAMARSGDVQFPRAHAKQPKPRAPHARPTDPHPKPRQWALGSRRHCPGDYGTQAVLGAAGRQRAHHHRNGATYALSRAFRRTRRDNSDAGATPPTQGRAPTPQTGTTPPAGLRVR
ncbi:hypothetical protein GWK47_031511 [Chionoecetes opilio]|uniref:Integrase catalytic domain-containing protein n=1 Tax=Chionoecetes opilio TaxID=41210 RepID=A0A8J4YL02_CHIOP|nr:hypothetical protein GWK47_031511 [Chionoecetes opilio]